MALSSYRQRVAVDAEEAARLLDAHQALLHCMCELRPSTIDYYQPYYGGLSITRPEHISAMPEFPFAIPDKLPKDNSVLSEMILSLQNIAKVWSDGSGVLDNGGLRQEYLEYAVQLFITIDSDFGPKSTVLECSAAARAIVVLPLGDVVTGPELLPFLRALNKVAACLYSLNRWYLITSPTVSRVISRALLTGRPINPALSKMMCLDKSAEASQFALDFLGGSIERLGSEWNYPSTWPSLLGPELSHAVIAHFAQRISHRTPDAWQLFSSLPLLHYIGESVLRDAATSLRVRDAGISDIFIRAIDCYDLGPDTLELVPHTTPEESIAARDFPHGEWKEDYDSGAVLLCLSLTYFGAQAGSNSKPKPRDPNEFDAVIKLVGKFMVHLSDAELQIDTVELLVRQSLTSSRQSLIPMGVLPPKRDWT